MAAKETTQNEGMLASMMHKNFERWHAMMDEMAKMEDKAMQQSHKNVDDAAKMMKAGLDYTNDLTAQWRQMMVESTKMTQEMMPWS
jgi:hypothetical protein